MTVEEKIREYLIDNDIEQKELSQLTGIHTSKISLSLNGKRRLKFVEYELICGGLGLPIGTFLEAKIPSNNPRAG